MQLASANETAAWQKKVDPALLDQLNSKSSASSLDFIIQLDDQAQLDIPNHLTKEEKGIAVFEQLKAHAEQSQQELIKVITEQNGQFEPYFLINAVRVVGDRDLLIDLAQNSKISYVHANPAVQLDVQSTSAYPFEYQFETTSVTVEWGIDKIEAPLVWANGITGTGAVLAGQDTGYNWEHPALQPKYRGWDGATADHNYNWHDSISTDISGNSFNPCGYELTVPCDDIGSQHGTHTMGTMVGADGVNQIGVAPGAEWIACRNMEEGYGTPDTYIGCFEWFLAPTNLAGENADPAKAPHVINNSWGCPPSEGCNTSNFNMMNAVIENLRAAGIVVVASAGNSGSSCSTVSSPASIFEGTFSVGATSSSDDIASFSSRGPVTADGSSRMKPNVTAPGVSVRSAGSGDSYRSLSGTSMAGPHVAGAVGLMISAYPPIAGNVEAIESYLEETAEYIGIGNCGGDEAFNNTFGHGRINVNDAVEAIWNIDIVKNAPISLDVPFQEADPAVAMLTYTIELTKTGEWLTFTNGMLSDTIPAGSSFVSASGSPLQNGDQLTWDLGDLSPTENQTISVTISFTGTQDSSKELIYPSALVTADNVPSQSSNTATTTVQFESNPGNTFTIMRDIPQSFEDERITQTNNTLQIEYQISVTAPISIPTLTNTIITETLPAGATLISTTLPISSTPNGFEWQTGTLSASESVSLTVVIEIPLSAEPQTTLEEITFPATRISSDQTTVAETEPIVLIPYITWLPLVIES